VKNALKEGLFFVITSKLRQAAGKYGHILKLGSMADAMK
jgi:hypothetical protein